MKTRIEKDQFGEVNIGIDKYWGIHTERALSNFPISNAKVPLSLIQALAMVKKACLQTNSELGFLNQHIIPALISACDEIIEGKLSDQFPLDAYQGGAGTSTNLNVNEVIANRALELLGHEKGDYDIINPIDIVNLHQSTNDVYPTALKIAVIFGFRKLSENIAGLQGALQQKEKEFAEIVMLGRTEMQDAVPMTLGSQFASFAEAIARDRWRTFKCEERLRIVNIGGTAIGTGLTAPRSYIFLVIEKLRQVTGLGLSRAEQVMDATANTDAFVEVFGMLNAHAVNLIKIANDLRFLHYMKEIELPAVQTGSSIMPGKINPVIIEAVLNVGMKILANNELINQCSAHGSGQINEFLPLVAHTMLESLEILSNINKIFTNYIEEIKANPKISKERFEKNEIIITAFLPVIGYERAEELLHEYHMSDEINFRKFLSTKLGEELVAKILSPGNLMSLGYRKENG